MARTEGGGLGTGGGSSSPDANLSPEQLAADVNGRLARVAAGLDAMQESLRGDAQNLEALAGRLVQEGVDSQDKLFPADEGALKSLAGAQRQVGQDLQKGMALLDQQIFRRKLGGLANDKQNEPLRRISNDLKQLAAGPAARALEALVAAYEEGNPQLKAGEAVLRQGELLRGLEQAAAALVKVVGSAPVSGGPAPLEPRKPDDRSSADEPERAEPQPERPSDSSPDATDTPGAPPELVMEKEGWSVTATTGQGMITIQSFPGTWRRYVWGACKLPLELKPRGKRYRGSLGIFYQGPYPGTPCDDLKEVQVEEGRQNFASEAEALEWIKSCNAYLPHVYRQDGLMLGWGINRKKQKLLVVLWQITIGGQKPAALPGGQNEALSTTGWERH